MYIFYSFYLLHSYNPSFLICLCFNMVSLRGQKKFGPRPDRSPLGVKFKISDEHPHPFHIRSPPPGGISSCLNLLSLNVLINTTSLHLYLSSETFTGLYTKWDSFTPRKYKINLVRTLAFRCYRICPDLIISSSLTIIA